MPDNISNYATKCPYCGSLLPSSFSQDKIIDVTESIRLIIALYGPVVITEDKFIALLADFAVDFPKERRWIRTAVSELGLGKLFYEAHISEDRAVATDVAFRLLKDEDGASDEKAKFIVNCFSYGLGWIVDPIALPSTEKPEARVDTDTAERLYEQGMQYYTGNGVAQNYFEAAKRFIQASDKDSAPAQYQLGIMYQDGLHYGKNPSEAVNWFLKSKSYWESNFSI
jgi:TPR repeat protein